MTKSLWTESEAKSLWVEVFRHQKAESELSADDLDAMSSDDLNAWLSDGRMLKDAVCELANQTQMQMADLWKDAVDAESHIWKQAISRTACRPVEAADDEPVIPLEFQTKPMTQKAYAELNGVKAKTIRRWMKYGHPSGEKLRFMKKGSLWIFDNRQDWSKK
jgi:hypothetical protein